MREKEQRFFCNFKRACFFKKLKHTIFYLLLAILFFAPVMQAQAVLPEAINNLGTAIENILINVVKLIIGLAFVVFLWGVFKYITSASVESKEGGRMLIIYGLIGLFVMLAAWGLVFILLSTFGFSTAPITPGESGGFEIPKGFKQ